MLLLIIVRASRRIKSDYRGALLATTTIHLKDFASYRAATAVTVKVEKPVAIIYGQNGVGKSTIAKAIRHHADASLGPAGACSVTVDGLSNPEFFIYDIDYVEDTFQSKDSKGIKGIFTLGKKTAEDLSAITDAENEEKTAQELVSGSENSLGALASRADATITKAKEATWSIKTDFEKGPLKFCLGDRKLLADKLKLFQFLHGYPKADGSHFLEDLLSDAKEIGDENASSKEVITIPNIDVADIEKSPLLPAVIVGSADSKLSPLITKLQNESWVRRGMSYPHSKDDPCPFCQQAVPHDFAEDVAKLFDSAYEEQCDQLRVLQSSYASKLASFNAVLATHAYREEYVTSDMDFQSATKDVLLILERNLAVLGRKADNPGEPIHIEPSESILSTWGLHANRVLSRINEYNDRIKNISAVKQALDKRFWERVKHDYAAPLAIYDADMTAIKIDESNIKTSLAIAEADRLKAQQKLRTLRKDSTNIDASVDAINRRIKNIGISGFSIEKDATNPGYYHIARGFAGKVSYKSLSEGEKTLITFLYFLESLDGSHNADGNTSKANRIVVIDDPVSSLSHNHVYDIASLITNVLIAGKAFPQIIILTHSLFFFHEIFKSAPGSSGKQYQCFRVVKGDHSEVKAMAHDEINNDYQAYWLVLREAIQSNKYSVAIPIAMRYILEHYFGFIGYHSTLKEALLSLGDREKEFQAFYRYINRQSHSDEINISDLPAIDPAIYVEKFKKVFVETEHSRHFDHMMGFPEVEK